MANVGQIEAQLVLSTEQWSQAVETANQDMQQLGNSAQNVSQDLGRIQTAALAVGGALVAGIGASVKTAADFEAQMSRVKAISGATDEEFGNLREAALDLGASTSKSASEIAIAFEDMAAKGFNATQIIEAMPGVIAAAEASGSDLALTADVVSSALNGFQLEAAEASRIADILAKAANISAASMDDMGYAFKYVGPVANTLGIEIEEVAAAIGIMTDSGLDGSNAGTALRAALIALNNPAKAQAEIMKEIGFSMQDSNGEAKSLSAMFADLTKATEGMTQAEKLATVAKLVGTEASAGMMTILEGGVGQLNEFTGALKNSAGASQEAAAIMKDNLKGAVDELMGAIESVGIKVGDEFLPVLTDLAKEGAEIVSTIGEMDMSVVKSAAAFVGTTAAIGFTISALTKLGLAMRAFTLTPVGAAITGISILGGMIAATKIQTESMREVTLENAQAMMSQVDALDANIVEYDKLSAKSRLTSDELARFVDINSEISKTADPNVIAKLREEQSRLSERSGLTNEELNRMIDLNGQILDVVPDSSAVLTEQGNVLLNNTSAAKQYNAEQMELIRLELEAQAAKAEANMSQYLTDEKRLLAEQKQIKEDMLKIDKNAESQRKTIGDLEKDLAQAIAEGKDSEAKKIEFNIALEKRKLQVLKDEGAEKSQLLAQTEDEIQKTQRKIGKLDEVKRQMVDLELKQVGINAKRGQEISQIETAISKLETQKQKLQNNTPAAERNTEEYRRSVAAIDSQISGLNTARSRINDIIGRAQVMNSTLGSTIYKDVIIQERRYAQVTKPGQSGRIPEHLYHTGGIVGRGQMPKLHVGGLASQFASMPNHNEIDTRLLRNEMVLTEAQQSNLMRMIDAGFTQQGADISDNSEVVSLLRQIERGLSRGLNATVVMDERQVGRAVEPYVTEVQERKTSRRERF
ncbi:phage tail tape measure protein [Cytobacillus pseudoceanisediminis]|uniref:phage tail tape measure protein n=1 Tax=Cytobacillus pseudoceanisediminis TaxID=3051614 RepID=UPI003CED4ECC